MGPEIADLGVIPFWSPIFCMVLCSCLGARGSLHPYRVGLSEFPRVCECMAVRIRWCGGTGCNGIFSHCRTLVLPVVLHRSWVDVRKNQDGNQQNGRTPAAPCRIDGKRMNLRNNDIFAGTSHRLLNNHDKLKSAGARTAAKSKRCPGLVAFRAFLSRSRTRFGPAHARPIEASYPRV